MALKDGLIAELKHEASMTRKMLEKVPAESFAWKPHEKSMTLGRLATHVAEILHWVPDIINFDEYDFAARPFSSYTATSQQELVDILDEKVNAAIDALSASDEELFSKHWQVRRGEQVFFDLPKKVAVRSWAYNHLYHHRGQLSVYLRLLDVPVPGMYGPSADERM